MNRTMDYGLDQTSAPEPRMSLGEKCLWAVAVYTLIAVVGLTVLHVRQALLQMHTPIEGGTTFVTTTLRPHSATLRGHR